MRTETVVCEECSVEFIKSSREVKRSLKLNRKQYCSMSCAKKSSTNLAHLASVRTQETSQLIPENRLDEYTIFRTHLRRALTRKHSCDLTLEDLKEVWEQQEGKCVYSKVSLTPASHLQPNSLIYTMSLDRIDSSIGYTKTNVQFISMAMNYLKNRMSHNEMLEMLSILRDN